MGMGYAQIITAGRYCIEYWWNATDEAGNSETTLVSNYTFDDTRFNWKS